MLVKWMAISFVQPALAVYQMFGCGSVSVGRWLAGGWGVATLVLVCVCSVGQPGARLHAARAAATARECRTSPGAASAPRAHTPPHTWQPSAGTLPW